MLIKARKLVDKEAQAPPGLGQGWVGGGGVGGDRLMASAEVGVGVGAIPYGRASTPAPLDGRPRDRGDAGGKREAGIGQKEGKRVDELAWKKDWEKRHSDPIKSPWSSS